MKFKQWIAINMLEETTVSAAPITDMGRPFCLSHHIKCVCKSHYDVYHAHKHMLVSNHGIMEAWKDQLCGAAQLTAIKVYYELLGVTTISLRIRRTSGGRRELVVTT